MTKFARDASIVLMADVLDPIDANERLVERVTYRNAQNGFCVLRAKARGHHDMVTVVQFSHRLCDYFKNRPICWYKKPIRSSALASA